MRVFTILKDKCWISHIEDSALFKSLDWFIGNQGAVVVNSTEMKNALESAVFLKPRLHTDNQKYKMEVQEFQAEVLRAIDNLSLLVIRTSGDIMIVEKTGD